MIKSLWDLFCNELFTDAVLSTLLRFCSGLSLSLAMCAFLIPMAVKYRAFGQALESFVFLLQPIPKVVLFPAFLLFLGISDLTRALLISTGLFFTNFIILYSATMELIHNPAKKIILFYRTEPRQVFFEYYLKGLRAPLLSSLKNSTGYGLTLTLITESYFSNTGIGFLIWRFWERYELPELTLTILTTSALAMLLNGAWGLLLGKRH